jgi:hypothetical protein
MQPMCLVVWLVGLFVTLSVALSGAVAQFNSPVTVKMPISSFTVDGDFIYIASQNEIVTVNQVGQVVHTLNTTALINSFVVWNGTTAVLDYNKNIRFYYQNMLYTIGVAHKTTYGLYLNKFENLITAITMDPNFNTLVTRYTFNGGVESYYDVDYLIQNLIINDMGYEIYDSMFGHNNNPVLISIADSDGIFSTINTTETIASFGLTVNDTDILMACDNGLWIYSLDGRNREFLNVGDGNLVMDPQIFGGYIAYTTYQDRDFYTQFIDRSGNKFFNVSFGIRKPELMYFTDTMIMNDGTLVWRINNELKIWTPST